MYNSRTRFYFRFSFISNVKSSTNIIDQSWPYLGCMRMLDGVAGVGVDLY